MSTTTRPLFSSYITTLAAFASVLISSCGTGMYGFTYRPSNSDVLKNERFALSISAPPQTEWRATNFLFSVSVQNISSEEQVFDTGELEVKDLTTGVSYFSISKDKELVSLPADKTNVITKITLKPGQKIGGRLWFVTGDQEATAKKIELKSGNQSLTFER